MNHVFHTCSAKLPTRHPSQAKKAKSPKGQIQTSSEEEMASTKPEESPKTDSEGKRQDLLQESQGRTSSNLRSAAGKLDIYSPYAVYSNMGYGFSQSYSFLQIAL